MSSWTRTYKVTADFCPYMYWMIDAESESEARLQLVNLLGIPYKQTDATL